MGGVIPILTGSVGASVIVFPVSGVTNVGAGGVGGGAIGSAGGFIDISVVVPGIAGGVVAKGSVDDIPIVGGVGGIPVIGSGVAGAGVDIIPGKLIVGAFGSLIGGLLGVLAGGNELLLLELLLSMGSLYLI